MKDEILKEKIKLQRKIQILSHQVTETDYVCNTALARKMLRLRTELNFTEDYYATIK